MQRLYSLNNLGFFVSRGAIIASILASTGCSDSDSQDALKLAESSLASINGQAAANIPAGHFPAVVTLVVGEISESVKADQIQKGAGSIDSVNPQLK